METNSGFKKFLKQRVLLLLPDHKITETELYAEAKEKIIENIKIRLFIMGVFLVATPIVKFLFGLIIPLGSFELVLGIMVLYTISSYPVVVKNYFKTSSALSNFYLAYLCLDVFVAMWLVLLEGFFSWAYIIPTYYIIYGYLVFPRYWQSFVMFLASSFAMVFIHLAVFFNWMSANAAFSFIDISYLKNFNYTASLLINVVFAYYFVAQWCCMFAWRLKEEKQKLKMAKQDLETERASLEKKVESRTEDLIKEGAELEELAGSLKDRVEERTKELQKKIEELERFRKLAVGRELKMIELKKEITRLERDPEKPTT